MVTFTFQMYDIFDNYQILFFKILFLFQIQIAPIGQRPHLLCTLEKQAGQVSDNKKYQVTVDADHVFVVSEIKASQIEYQPFFSMHHN